MTNWLKAETQPTGRSPGPPKDGPTRLECRKDTPETMRDMLLAAGWYRPDADVRGFVSSHAGNRGDMARFYSFCLIFDQLMKEGIKGDLAELGVYKGGTATLIANIARHLGTTAYLYWIPSRVSRRQTLVEWTQQKMKFSDTTVEAVQALVGEKNVRYVKGHFPGSASQLPSGATFCLVHVDCDLYAPMLSALEYFYRRLVPGGFILHAIRVCIGVGLKRPLTNSLPINPNHPCP